MTPIIVHQTYTLTDHTTTMTLCGQPIRTDITATNRVIHTSTWVSCPLCQAAQIIDAAHITLPPVNHDRQPPKQPMFEGAESW